MTGLDHDFFLLNSKEHLFNDSEFNVCNLYKTSEPLKIHDGILLYLQDSLAWIPTYNRWKMKESNGLNFYGDTIIRKNGAIKASEIFSNWADLFRCGTENLELTGNYCYKPGKRENGYYEKIKVNRDEIVKKLETFAFYCDEVIKSDDEKFIWHFGI